MKSTITCKSWYRFRSIRIVIVFIALVIMTEAHASAQGFGQNKVQYETFHFKVWQTPHFDIHYYDRAEPAMLHVARMAERWYERLSGVLQHELSGRQPLILYASHPEFRQTNAIPGEVGETTGGVTEALKRRIVLPLAGPLSETDHVLGHELVHAFQFDMTRPSGSGLPGALQLPLWFVEGMAEYLSLGPVNSHTAMWMRDASLREDLPNVKNLNDPKYFPYRFGHAFWSYVAGRWGDEVIGRMLKTAGNGGEEMAIREVLGITAEQLSTDWHDSIRKGFGDVAETPRSKPMGETFLKGEKGRLNVSPSLSPDGKRVVFFSERDLFSIDLFMADVATGRIIRKLTETAIDPHVESLQFVNSSGAWSKDGRLFAFGSINKGKPVLTVVESETGDIIHSISIPDAGEIFNPTWSPDGQSVAIAAVAGGLTDLFIVDLQTGGTRRVTNDAFAALHPAWSPDGKSIAFVTDRFTTDLESLDVGGYRIAILDVVTGDTQMMPGQADGKNINPQWSPNGEEILFLSDRSGITNLYAVHLQTREVRQLTNLHTGISGITGLSPALSVAAASERAAISVFEGGNYELHIVDLPSVPLKTTGALSSMAFAAPARSQGVVSGYLAQPRSGLPDRLDFTTRKYRPRLSLDQIAPPSFSVGASNFGTFVGSGTALYWSDLLGDHSLMTAVQLNTDGRHFFRNVSAMASYENRKRRWNWGAVVAQVPFTSGGFQQSLAVVGGEPVVFEDEARAWEIHREVSATAAYPFNRAQRVEFSTGFRNISFAQEVESRAFLARTGQEIARERQPLATPPSLRMNVSSAALVYDTSIAAGLSPIMGQRYRFETSTTLGDLRHTTLMADYRRYFRLARPLTLATRVFHFGRYGSDAEDRRLQDLFLGYPSLVRGYAMESFHATECGSTNGQTCPTFDRLVGSRVGVANVELRTQLFGPLGIAGLRRMLPVEAAYFADTGLAWRSAGPRSGVSSHGASLRVNVLGFTTAQLSLVHPNNRPQKNWMWQFSLTTGF